MSHIHQGPLATYNSLTDKNLSSYFANTRMRRHLRKAGLINRKGVIISENQYRLNMARKEHKKYVKDLLAQAIVHKSLDLERTRQVEIKNKLEEIAKIELVRRVRSSRGRRGDEEVLPYLSPRSRSHDCKKHRPHSAPNPNQYEDVIYVDENGRPLTPTTREMVDDLHSPGTNKGKEQIDTRHLYALDSAALKKYALTLSKIEQGEGLVSPYSINQVPTPPRSARSSHASQSGRLRQRPRTADARTGSVRRSPLQVILGDSQSEEQGTAAPSTTTSQNYIVEGSLMLHRQEPAVMHQGEVQTLCEITMKYHGPNLTLPRDQFDPCQDVSIDQQHCGGNTLTVFKEKLKPGEMFSFTSRRHRGYPFSLSVYIEGRIDFRISRCCEYKHFSGVRLGGKLGHFSLMKVTGATPCYRCALNAQATPRSLKRPAPVKKIEKAEEIREDIIPTGKTTKTQPQVIEEEEKDIEIHVEGAEATPQQDNIFNDLHAGDKRKDDDDASASSSESESDDSDDDDKADDEKYEDDFEEDEDAKKETEKYDDDDFESSKSSSSSSSEDEEEPPPQKSTEIQGFIADAEQDQKVGKDKGFKGTGLDRDRKIEGYSSEEEYLDDPSKFESPYKKKVTDPQGRKLRGRRDSVSSRSSSSSSEERKEVQKIRKDSKDEVKKETSYFTRKSSYSSDSDFDAKDKKSPPRRKSSSSSSSRSSIDDKPEPVTVVSPTFPSMIATKPDRQGAQTTSVTDIGAGNVLEPVAEKQSPSPPAEKKVEKPLMIYEDQQSKKEEARRRLSISSSSSESDDDDKKKTEIKSVQVEDLDERLRRLKEDEPEPIKSQEVEQEDELKTDHVITPQEAESSPVAEVEVEEYRTVSPDIVVSEQKEAEQEKPQSTQERLPDPFAYKRMYEDNTPVYATPQKKEVVDDTPQKATLTVHSARSATSGSSADSSSDSSSDEETQTEPGSARPELKEEKPDDKPETKKSSSSSSESSSDTETQTETDTDRSKPVVRAPSPPKLEDRAPTPPKPVDRVPTPPKEEVKDVSKKSSSSSESSSESDTETQTETDTDRPKPEKRVISPSPPLVKKEEVKKSSGSESSSSSSDSETETQTETESEKPNKEASPVAMATETRISPPPDNEKDKQKTVSDTGTSSGSSSDSETETENEAKSKPDQPEPEKPASPTPIIEQPQPVEPEPSPPKVEKGKPVTDSELSSDSSDSETETGTATETENEKSVPVKQAASPTPVSVEPVVDSQPPIEPERKPSPPPKPAEETKPKSDTETGDSSDSNSDSSSDSDSDSDTESEKKSKKEDEKQPEKKVVEFPLEDSDAPHIQSESDGDQLKYNVFGSGSGTDHMHGGNDPDNVATEGPVKSAYLSKIGIKPGQPVEGSILHRIEGQADVDLSTISLTTAQVEELAAYLVKAFNVESLSLRNSGIGDETFSKLVDALMDTKSSIKMLNFNLNKLGPDSADDVTEILEEKTCVKTLLLHGNPLGDQGVKSLIQGLLEFTDKDEAKPLSLKELDLGDTQMGDEGVMQVAKLLEKNQGLEILNLNGNKSITEVGWKRLAKALKKNTTLRTLSLDFNNIGDKGIEALVGGLKDNQTLRTLEMEDAGITKEGGKLLRDLVKCNTFILDITIYPGNAIPEPLREDIRRYLALNNVSKQF